MYMSKINTTANALSTILISTDLYQSELLGLVSSIIWKDTKKANLYEKNNFYLIDIFILAHRGLLSFENVKSFPRVIFSNLGVDSSLVYIYSSDKREIPVEMRKIVLDEYVKGLTSKNIYTGRYQYLDKNTNEYVELYEEANDYYRTLAGLPAYGSKRFLYNSDPRWDTTTPLHLMNLSELLHMEDAGVLDAIIKANPKDEYIKFLGRKRINYYDSRVAERFQILYMDNIGSDLLQKTFVETYNQCIRLTNSVYYSKIMSKQNDLYENFLAMSISFMTIQSMFYKYLITDTTRDFFDTESLKLIYDSYQVPFYSEIPLEYHRKIVKNINRLLSYKGSSNVFFDLFEIFDLGSMDIFSYYLTKIHKIDADGVPIFKYLKDDNGDILYDDNGDPILDPSVYDINFSRVPIFSDPALGISDTNNSVDYEQVTKEDPYWIDDIKLQKKLEEEFFNYNESKYLGIQTVFDLMRITYENAYVFRMITDNKDITKHLSLKWLELNIDLSTYDLFIYLAAIYCRHYGYSGMISNYIPAIVDTLGFNFEEVEKIVYEEIYSNPLTNTDTELIKLLQGIKTKTLDNLSKNLDIFTELRSYLSDKYTTASTRESYYAYKALYDSLLISREVTDVYTDNNGKIYENFADILLESSPELTQRYLTLADSELANEMDLIIAMLEKNITSLRYLPYSAGVSTSNMIESLFRILKFFKSAKAELVDYKITYVISERGINFFKNMDELVSSFTLTRIESIMTIQDLLKLAHEIFWHFKDKNIYLDRDGNVEYFIKLKDTHIFKDFMKLVINGIFRFVSEESINFDFLECSSLFTKFKDLHNFDDRDKIEVLQFDILEDRYFAKYNDIQTMVDFFELLYCNEPILSDEQLMQDLIKLIMTCMKVNTSLMSQLDDIREELIGYLSSDMSFETREIYSKILYTVEYSIMNIHDGIKLIMNKVTPIREILTNYDKLIYTDLFKGESTLDIYDVIYRLRELYSGDTDNLYIDKFKSENIITYNIEDDNETYDTLISKINNKYFDSLLVTDNDHIELLKFDIDAEDYVTECYDYNTMKDYFKILSKSDPLLTDSMILHDVIKRYRESVMIGKSILIKADKILEKYESLLSTKLDYDDKIILKDMITSTNKSILNIADIMYRYSRVFYNNEDLILSDDSIRENSKSYLSSDININEMIKYIYQNSIYSSSLASDTRVIRADTKKESFDVDSKFDMLSINENNLYSEKPNITDITNNDNIRELVNGKIIPLI